MQIKLPRLLLLLLLLLPLAATAACARQPPRMVPEPLDAGVSSDSAELDAQVLELAQSLSAAGPAANELWPGVWSPGRSVVLWPYQGGALLVGPLPPSYEGPSRLLESPSSGRAGGGQIRALPDIGPVFRLHFDFPLGEERVFAAEYVPRVNHDDVPSIAAMIFVYHELFHAYQANAFAADDIDLDAAFDAIAAGGWDARLDEEPKLLARERALLQRAVAARAGRDAIAHLRDYFTQVDLRVPRVVRVGEEAAQRTEGTATYFGYAATVRARGLPEGDLQRWIERDLNTIYPYDAGRGIEGIRNWHTYAAGAAKSLLLSRLVPDWRVRVEQGATLDRLLLELVEEEDV